MKLAQTIPGYLYRVKIDHEGWNNNVILMKRTDGYYFIDCINGVDFLGEQRVDKNSYLDTNGDYILIGPKRDHPEFFL